MTAERGSFVERAAKFSQKIDYVLIGSGIAISIFNPGVGAAIIIGSALTLIPAKHIENWAKRKSS